MAEVYTFLFQISNNSIVGDPRYVAFLFLMDEKC